MVLGRTRRVHFVGIGGIGMSGIAELLVNLGYDVSGSDQAASPTLERLTSMGVATAVGHAAANVGPADVVVYSSAITVDNIEIVDARSRGIAIVPRAEMLAELMRLRVGIAVAGAHGKTSTTSMIALVLERAGLDPTAVIGGRLRAFGSNARLGHGQHMVVEADESDRSFLKLSPTLAVITNLDREHMEAYGGFEDLQQAFVDFANKVPFYGAVVACADDPELARILPRLGRRATTYGISAPDVAVGATEVVLAGFGSTCTVVHRDLRDRQAPAVPLGRLRLQVPGRHSVLNALAAVAVGLELGVPYDVIASALEEFVGAERRFEVRGVVNGITVVDDYGHHPTEIAAVLAAARAAAPSRIVVAFQPHRYSRTAQLLPDFAASLASADEIVLTEIYAASEAPIPGVTVEALADAVNRRRGRPVVVIKALDDIAAAVADLARPGDLVITLGAGSIGAVPGAIMRELERRHAAEAQS